MEIHRTNNGNLILTTEGWNVEYFFGGVKNFAGEDLNIKIYFEGILCKCI